MRAATEIAGPVLYLVALGLFFSFFIPYVLLWLGVGVESIFLFVPLIIAVALYFAGVLLIPDVPYKTYLVMAVIMVPLLLFPNLRVHSTFFDRIAPSLGKALMALSLGAFFLSLFRSLKVMGIVGTSVIAGLSLLLGLGLSSLLPAGGIGWVMSPSLVLSLLLASLVLFVSGWLEASG